MGEASSSAPSDTVPPPSNTAHQSTSSAIVSEVSTTLRNGSCPTTDHTNFPTTARSCYRWHQAKTLSEHLWNIAYFVARAIFCSTNVVFFFLAYFGFMIPALWAKYLWPRLYWFYEGKLYKWLKGFVAYWGYTAGYDVYEYGDDIEQFSDERVLIIANHQSTADVPTFFAVMQNKGVAPRKTLWLMSAQFRWTPFGIVSAMHGDYFVRQGKENRERELVNLRRHLQNVFWKRDRRWVILFPEGGFFYKRKEIDRRYAQKNGFPILKNVTLPRLGAMQTILEEIGPRSADTETDQPKEGSDSPIDLLRDTIGDILEKKYLLDTRPPIKYVIDATIAYPNGRPLSLVTLCFGTREKCNIAVHYKVYNVAEVPFRDEEKLRKWMYDIFIQKDALLEHFYKFGCFEPGKHGKRVVFTWELISGQYAFWTISIFLQWEFYSWLFYRILAYIGYSSS